MLIESSLVKSGAKIRLSFELKIKPAFESGEFLLADCDFTLIRRTYRYRYFSVEVGFGMVYGIDAQDNLPVGTEEAVDPVVRKAYSTRGRVHVPDCCG